MTKDPSADLIKFLRPFGSEATALVLGLRDFVWGNYPQSNELIYDNYNALALGWSLSERLGHTFCSIAVFRTNKNVHFGFYRGAELSDPKKLLLGKGNQYRYVLVKVKDKFPNAYIKQLLKQAYINARTRLTEESETRVGMIITKSISPTKRARVKRFSKKDK
jgi:Domain of unknown function (DU1801)